MDTGLGKFAPISKKKAEEILGKFFQLHAGELQPTIRTGILFFAKSISEKFT